MSSGSAGSARETTGITTPAVVSPEANGADADDTASRAAGDLVVTGDEPAAPRRRLRRHLLRVGQLRARPNPTHDLIRVSEQCAAAAPRTAILRARLPLAGLGRHFTGAYTWHASASYVTGAHSMKLGYQGTLLTDERTWFTNNQTDVPGQQRRAESTTQSISPWVNNARAAWHALSRRSSGRSAG